MAKTAQPQKFWDRMAERYSKKPVADQASYEKKLEITRRYFRPDMEVLEIGCGTGSTALAHAPYVKHIRATDLSPKMLAIAQRKADAAQVANVTFEHAAVADVTAPDGSVDVAMAHSILHLLEDPDTAIAKIRKMLKPGGVFVSSTVCIADMMPLWRLLIPIARLIGMAPMVKILSKTDVVASMKAAGFEIDHEWQPGKRISVFLVAKKPAA